MIKGSAIVAEARGVSLQEGAKRRETRRLWFYIYFGVLLGVTLSGLLKNPLPSEIRVAMIWAAWMGYMISWHRWFYQKQTIGIITLEPPEQLELKIDEANNMVAMCAGNGKGSKCVIPVFKKYRCEKQADDGVMTYYFMGIPTNDFNGANTNVINEMPNAPCHCQYISRIHMRYVVLENEPAELLSKLDKLVAKADKDILRVPKQAQSGYIVEEKDHE